MADTKPPAGRKPCECGCGMCARPQQPQRVRKARLLDFYPGHDLRKAYKDQGRLKKSN